MGARPSSTIELLAGRHETAATPVDLGGLARILHLSAGVVRVAVRRDGRRFLFRPAGSAGGLFPLELYVAARGVSGLVDGVYWYDPVEHSLRLVAPPAIGDATTIVVTGIPWRTGWRYAERGFRHMYWDAGTMLANTLALAESGGHGPRLLTRFPDAAVARLVGADGTQEFPLAIVTLGRGAPAIGAGRRGSNRLDRHGTRRVSARDARPACWRRGEARRAVADRAAGWGRPAGDGRPRRGHPASRLGADARCDGCCRLPGVRAIARRIASRNSRAALHRRPCRRWARGGTLPVARSRASAAERVRLRDELWVACYGQDLGRDASFVVISAVDMDLLDDRGYRDAQLDAGIVEGRLHLAAYALGIGASGMTFLDSEIPALLGEPLAALLFTCVGVPHHRTRRAGTPRDPADVGEA